MKTLDYKRRITSQIWASLLFFTLVVTLGVSFYLKYSLILREAKYDAFGYYLYFIRWGSFLYVMFTLLFIPVLLNNFNISIASDEMDQFIIQRIGYKTFYRKQILLSFLKGFSFAIILNVFLIILFMVVTGFDVSKASNIVDEHLFNLFKSPTVFQLVLFNLMSQSFGIGLINIGLFLMTRFNVNKYFFYLSVLFLAIVFTTGLSALLSMMSTIIPSLYNFYEVITGFITIINPLTLLFPLQTFFGEGQFIDIQFLFSFLIYIVFFLSMITYKLKSETLNG